MISYTTAKMDHGLPRNPFKALVAPRPIGWISSVSRDGAVNLAPYSFFNAVSDPPPMVVFSGDCGPDGAHKDSVRNIEETGEFVCNLVTHELVHQMNTSSAGVGPEVDEFDTAGLTKEASLLVAPPRVKEAKAQMECRLTQLVPLPERAPGMRHTLVIGEVVAIHIDEAILTDGFVDYRKAGHLARLGYMDYAYLTDTFSLDRPG